MDQLEFLRVEREILELKQTVDRINGEFAACSRMVHALLATHPDPAKAFAVALRFQGGDVPFDGLPAHEEAMASFKRAAELKIP